MKKFYTLLTMLLMASATIAQTISVTVNGKTVANGETVECQFDEIEKHPIPALPALVTYEMTPHVMVKSNVSQDVSVTIDVQEKKGDNQIQNCFVSCITANSANNFVVKQTSSMDAGQEKDAQIHFSSNTDPNERPLDRHVLVTVEAGSETLTFTLHMFWDPDGTLNVGGIEIDSKNAPAYSLSGAKVNSESLPAGSIYVKKGKKFIKK